MGIPHPTSAMLLHLLPILLLNLHSTLASQQEVEYIQTGEGSGWVCLPVSSPSLTQQTEDLRSMMKDKRGLDPFFNMLREGRSGRSLTVEKRGMDPLFNLLR